MKDRFSYEIFKNWEQLPEGFAHRDVVGVTVDRNDRVYMFTRSDPRVIVYEPDGRFVTSWGDGWFTNRTHGIRFGLDGAIFAVDDEAQTVRKFTPDGKLLMTLGTPGVASDTGYDPKVPGFYPKLKSIRRGGPPFNRPTGVAVAPDGELYVSDGYANARVHRFSPAGKLIQSWGEPGTGIGEFNLPHDVWVTDDGRVLVADRENDRIQIFSRDGEYIDQWTDVQCPMSLCGDRQGLVYVAELWRQVGQPTFLHGTVKTDQPGRVSVLDPRGKVLARLGGGGDRCAPGSFCAPHGICVDSHGDIYVGEVTYTIGVSKGLVPADCHTFQKFVRKTMPGK